MDSTREPARKWRRLVSQFVDLEADAADDDGEDEEGYEEEGEEGEEEEEYEEEENVNGRFAIVTQLYCTKLNCEDLNDGQIGQTTLDRYQEFEKYINDMMAPYLQRPVTAEEPQSQASHYDDHNSVMRPPCWLRLCKKHLDFDKGIKRYRADAALGFELKDGSYDILLIPRFRFRFEKRGGRPPRRLSVGQGDMPAGIKARKIGDNTYKFIFDEIFVPFVVKRDVPSKFFEKGKTVRSVDISFFATGMLTFKLNHETMLMGEKYDRFMLISSELFLRSPLEAGEQVRIETGSFMNSVGEVMMANHDIDTYSVRIDGREDGLEVEGVHLRRCFSVGDHVSVVNSLANDWVGGVCFIAKLEGSLITVQSRDTKDEVRRSSIMLEFEINTINTVNCS